MTEKLSERVEQLEGPRFTIEQEIGRLINPQATRLSVFPAYTASLDAAMSLVPEGVNSGDTIWNVEGWSSNGVHAPHVRATAWVVGAPRVYAATPAIALCAAALKSRGL